MFPIDAQYDGIKLDKEYVTQRIKWEPLYEVTQIKEDGEAHPLLSPEDEFADYETWDSGSFGPAPKTPEMLPKEYARGVRGQINIYSFRGIFRVLLTPNSPLVVQRPNIYVRTFATN